MQSVYSKIARRIGMIGTPAFALISLGLYSVGNEPRVVEFSPALRVTMWQNICACIFVGALLFRPVRKWIIPVNRPRRRLRLYGFGVAATLILPVLLLPVWMPTPLYIFVIGESFVVICIFALLTERERRTGLWFLIASIIVLVLTLQYSAQIRLLNKFDWKNASLRQMTLVTIGTFLDAADTIGSSALMIFDNSSLPAKAKIRSVHLRIEPGSLEEMAGNLPQSAKAKYYDGFMYYPDGTWKRVKYRMRGRSIWHWMPEKPSLRVRLRKADPQNLQRHINFVNPEDRAMVANILGEEVARNMGVLTHKSQFVRLFINNKFFGVYHQTTREDEEMLRLNKRVPGPIVLGEYLRVPWQADAFELAGDTKILEDVNPVSQLVDSLAMQMDSARYVKLWSIISFEKLAKWDAAMKIVGGTHTDASHNHAYYFDPRFGKLEPIVTDVNGHGTLTHPRWLDRHLKPYVPDYRVPINERLQPLLDAALRDPRFMHRRNQLVMDALTGYGSEKTQNEILDRYYADIDGDVRADKHKAAIEPTTIGFFRQPFSNSQFNTSKKNLRQWIRNRNDFLREKVLETAVSLSIAEGANNLSIVLAEVSGNSAVEIDRTNIQSPILADISRSGTFVPASDHHFLLFPGLVEDFNFVYPITGAGKDRYSLMPGTQRYLFALKGVTPLALASILKTAIRRALDGQAIEPDIKIVDKINPADVEYNPHTVHSWSLPSPQTKDIRFGPGRHIVTSDIIVGQHQRLLVSAGARLLLAPGVSIFSRGQVRVEGEPTNPVVIRRLEPDKAWGGITIVGTSSNDSLIRFADISGGSFSNRANIIASGMVSVYGVRGTRIENSTISSNVLSDDTLHVVYGDVRLSQNRFHNCFGDCIDFDYTNGTIDGLNIEDAGNDGVDFMTSSANLKNIKIFIAGDKGLSVGEASNVEVSNLDVRNTTMGIAVKDSSNLKIANSTIRASEFGIDIHSKNWRYAGPGNATLTNTMFEGNQVDVQTEVGGTLTMDQISNPKTFAGDGLVEHQP